MLAPSPSPHALFVRLLLLVCVPHRRPLLGERALLLLLRLAPQLHPALPPLWDNHVPKLLAFLQQAPGMGQSYAPQCARSGGVAARVRQSTDGGDRRRHSALLRFRELYSYGIA